MELALSIAGVLIAATSVAISLKALSHNKIEAINSFFSNDRDPGFIEARSIVHLLPEKYDPAAVLKEHGSQIAILILSYEQAGILVWKRQLPFYIFSKAGCGVAVVKSYKKLRPYIEHKRTENPLYAKYFEYLCNRIIKKGLLRNFVSQIS
jgi:hypothetical protein